VRGGSRNFAAANLVDGAPETYWATDDGAPASEVVLELPKETAFNVVGLRENPALGQRVDRFAIDVERDGTWRECARACAIGNRRLLRIEPCTVRRVRLRILEAAACPAVVEFALYSDPHAPEPKGEA
jgi:alpha-L-fucosidase